MSEILCNFITEAIKSHRIYDISIIISLKCFFLVLVTIKLTLFPPQRTNKIIIPLSCFLLDLREVFLFPWWETLEVKKNVVKKKMFILLSKVVWSAVFAIFTSCWLQSEHFTTIFIVIFWQAFQKVCNFFLCLLLI